jgi:uncharacterized protein (DUF697 family)
MRSSDQPPSSRRRKSLVGELLDLPIFSTALLSAQSQGIKLGNRLRQQHPQSNTDQLVEEAIQRAMWRTAGTGALAGLGGVLALPAGGGDLLYFFFAQIELSAAILTLFGVELEKERYQPILIAAALGLSVNELLRLLGSRLGEQAARQMLRKLSGDIARRSWLGLGRLVPIGGALVGGGLNALLMRGAGEAMRCAAKRYKQFLDEQERVEIVQVNVVEA